MRSEVGLTALPKAADSDHVVDEEKGREGGVTMAMIPMCQSCQKFAQPPGLVVLRR
jgi:hypothetical protein